MWRNKMLNKKICSSGDEDLGERLVDGGGVFQITINDVEVKLSDSVPVGWQILGESWFLPTGDNVLIQLLCHRTRSVDLDEPVDLRKKGSEAIRTFKCDRLVTVYLDNDVEKRILSSTYSTEELISVLWFEAGYLLNVFDGQGKLVLLKPKHKTTDRKGMKFFSQVPCGGSW